MPNSLFPDVSLKIIENDWLGPSFLMTYLGQEYLVRIQPDVLQAGIQKLSSMVEPDTYWINIDIGPEVDGIQPAISGQRRSKDGSWWLVFSFTGPWDGDCCPCLSLVDRAPFSGLADKTTEAMSNFLQQPQCQSVPSLPHEPRFGL